MDAEWTLTLRRRDGFEATTTACCSNPPMSRIPFVESGEGQIAKFMQFGKKHDAPALTYYDLVEHDAFNRTALYVESEDQDVR